MNTATKAQVREAAKTATVEVTVLPEAGKGKKTRTPKATPFKDMVAATEAALNTEIGEAAPAPAKAEKAPKASKPAEAGPQELYAMPAGVEVRAGTRKAAVYEAMLAISPATRNDLIAAAEMAEQEWRKETKRLEAPKPGAKWFRRFAPLAEGIATVEA